MLTSALAATSWQAVGVERSRGESPGLREQVEHAAGGHVIGDPVGGITASHPLTEIAGRSPASGELDSE